MEKEFTRNLRLGFFVTAGAVLLAISLYIIGSKKNLFGSTFKIKAMFYNVNGLVPGNNVRYSGIDVGTVGAVEIVNDTAVVVVMILNKEMQKFVKKNSLAAIGTDGLMGNKIVNITTLTASSEIVAEGDVIQSVKPIDTDVVMRTLNTTNENVEAISGDLRSITKKLNNSNTLWSLLLDTVVSQNVKQAIVNIKHSSNNVVQLTGDMSEIVQSIKNGNGSMASLLLDTIIAGQLQQALVEIKVTGKNSAIATGNLQAITEKIQKGEGTIGALIMDTTLITKMNRSLDNIQKGSEGFNQNMEALKQVPFIRNYFKEKKTNGKSKEQPILRKQ